MTLLNTALEEFLRHLSVEKGARPSTITNYRHWTRHFIRWHCHESGQDEGSVDLSALSEVNVRKYRYYCTEQKAHRPRTVRSTLIPLRGLGDYLVEMGAWKENPVKKVLLPKKDAARRDLVSDEECGALLSACSRLPKVSDRITAKAILSVYIFGGLRTSEVQNLKRADVNVDLLSLEVRDGKGGLARTQPISSECMESIKAHLVQPQKGSNEWLWAFDSRRRYHDDGLRTLVEAVKSVAGLADHDNIKPHSLRHRYATRLMENQANIKQVQAALGHKNPQTTFLYLHLQEAGASVARDLSGLRLGQGFPAQAVTPPTPLPPKEVRGVRRASRRR